MISFCHHGLMTGTPKSHESSEIVCESLFLASKYNANSPGIGGFRIGVNGCLCIICY